MPVHAEWYCKHCDSSRRLPGVLGPPPVWKGPKCSEDELYFGRGKACVFWARNIKDIGSPWYEDIGELKYSTSAYMGQPFFTYSPDPEYGWLVNGASGNLKFLFNSNFLSNNCKFLVNGYYRGKAGEKSGYFSVYNGVASYIFYGTQIGTTMYIKQQNEAFAWITVQSQGGTTIPFIIELKKDDVFLNGAPLTFITGATSYIGMEKTEVKPAGKTCLFFDYFYQSRI